MHASTLRADDVAIFSGIALSIASIASAALGGPGWLDYVLSGGTIVALLAATLISHKARARARQKQQAQRQRIDDSVREYDALCHQIAGNSETQYLRLRESLGQMQDVFSSAASELNRSFTGNATSHSAARNDSLRHLADELLALSAAHDQAAQSTSLERFATETRDAIHGFVTTVQQLKGSGE